MINNNLINTDHLISTNDAMVMHDMAWELMQLGKQSHTSDMHQFFVATTDSHNNPQCRTVILRTVNKDLKQICFNTDQRSTKVKDLQNNPNTVALLYDHQHRVQLRLTCTATLHTQDAISQTAWAKARPQSKLTYGNQVATGTIIQKPTESIINTIDASPELLHFCEQHFMVVCLQINSLDMLFLHHSINKRIQANYKGAPTLHWIEP